MRIKQIKKKKKITGKTDPPGFHRLDVGSDATLVEGGIKLNLLNSTGVSPHF